VSDFLRMADEIGNHLTDAGRALETAARLLSENQLKQHLSAENVRGLIHTVSTMGESVRDAGYQLCEAVELESAEVREGQEVDHV
jgi:hypothetical protein